MMQHTPHILVVDDDDRIRALLQEYLRGEGLSVSTAQNAAEAGKLMELFLFDLMVLDVMMPGESGLELAAKINGGDNTPPILLLTAMGEAEDRIKGLESGADDYLTKPFEPRELLLRIRAILRRRNEAKAAEKKILTFGEFVFDPQQRHLSHLGEPIHLTSTEAELLCLLADHAGKAVSRAKLAALSTAAGTPLEERSVDVQINRLRKKIEKNTSRPVYIQTRRGEGYILQAQWGTL